MAVNKNLQVLKILSSNLFKDSQVSQFSSTVIDKYIKEEQ